MRALTLGLGVLLLCGLSSAGPTATQSADEIKRAADAGDPAAALEMGRRCEDGRDGVYQNYIQAFAYYTKSADAGNVQAMFFLGRCYADALGTQKNPHKALELFTKSADGGFARGIMGLALCDRSGFGEAKDPKAALELYQKAADQGFPIAMRNLSEMYAAGEGVPKDSAQADKWSKACVDAYQKQIAGGDTEAMRQLASLYYQGRLLPRDWDLSFKLFKQAADGGDGIAMVTLGVMFEQGLGVRQDYAQAAQWYEKSGEIGFQPAGFYDRGVMFENGHGSDPDMKQAVQWYLKAANLDQMDAMRRLVNCYRNGTGVEKDLKQSSAWSEKLHDLERQIRQNGQTQTASSTTKPSTTKPAAADSEALLAQRMQAGPLPATFDDVVSVLNVAHEVSVQAKDNCIPDSQLRWPFPSSYAPTIHELLDAIARQTQTHWRFEKSQGAFVFSKGPMSLPYTLKSTRLWHYHNAGDIVQYQPPGSSRADAMDVRMLGEYSFDQNADDQLNKIRLDLANQILAEIQQTAKPEDMKEVDVAGAKALYYELNPGADKPTWRQWVFIADGQAFAIVSALQPDQAKLADDVKAMVDSFKVRPNK